MQTLSVEEHILYIDLTEKTNAQRIIIAVEGCWPGLYVTVAG